MPVRRCLHDTGSRFIPERKYISYYVYMKSFQIEFVPEWSEKMPRARNRTAENQRNISTAHAQPSVLYRNELDSSLHDAGTTFRSGSKVSIRNENPYEFIPEWVIPEQVFVKYHVNKYSDLYRTGTKSFWNELIPVSCKHRLRIILSWLYTFFKWTM